MKSSSGRPHAWASVNVGDHPHDTHVVPIKASSEWTQIAIRDIHVTHGEATISFASRAAANQWLRVDKVSFTRD